MIDERRRRLFEKWEKKTEIVKSDTQKMFEKLFDQYEERFKDNPPTEPSSFTEEEWCEIFEECLEKNITVQELYGMDDEDDIY